VKGLVDREQFTDWLGEAQSRGNVWPGFSCACFSAASLRSSS
jgi:hypothetical protein